MTYGDARRGDRLGNNAVAHRDSPCDENLGGGGSDLLRQGFDLGVSDDGRAASDVLSERRVGGEVDVLVGAVLDEIVLLE